MAVEKGSHIDQISPGSTPIIKEKGQPGRWWHFRRVCRQASQAMLKHGIDRDTGQEGNHRYAAYLLTQDGNHQIRLGTLRPPYDLREGGNDLTLVTLYHSTERDGKVMFYPSWEMAVPWGFGGSQLPEAWQGGDACRLTTDQLAVLADEISSATSVTREGFETNISPTYR